MQHSNGSRAGKIPIIILLILAFTAGGGSVFLFSGKIRDSVNTYLVVLIVGIVMGLFVLPNLRGVIRWAKDIRNECKKEN